MESNISNKKILGQIRNYISLNSMRVMAAILVVLACHISITKTGMHSAFMWAYASPFLFAVVGCGFYNRDYFKSKRYLVFMLFPLWFVLSRWLCGDFFMMLDDQLMNAMLWYSVLLALPFASITGDLDSRKYFRIVCWVAVAIFALVLCITYAAVISGKEIILSDNEAFALHFGTKINEYGERILCVSNSHHYPIAYIAVTCFFITLYLMADCWKNKLIVFITLILEAVFCAAVFLIPCRTALIAFCGGLLMLVLIFLQRLKIKKRTVIIVFITLCVLAALFVLFAMDSVYNAVMGAGTVAINKLVNFSGRIPLWKAGFSLMRDEPVGLVRGFSLTDMLAKLIKYEDTGYAHMHNGFIEVLMLTGLPGLLAVIAFSVKLIISSVRVFFSTTGKGVVIAHKIMVVAVAALFFMNLFDSNLFINRTNADIVNFFFALFCGYIFEADEAYCGKSGIAAP